jgi:hypothetical protein
VLNPQINLCTIRIINTDTISKFKLNLCYEVGEEIFADSDVDTLFNNFLATYLTAFYHCFPLIRKRKRMIG